MEVSLDSQEAPEDTLYVVLALGLGAYSCGWPVDNPVGQSNVAVNMLCFVLWLRKTRENCTQGAHAGAVRLTKYVRVKITDQGRRSRSRRQGELVVDWQRE